MKKEPDTFSYHEHDDNYPVQACSAMDCTGLIPALPETEEQLEYFKEFYSLFGKGGRQPGNKIRIQ